VEYRLSVCLKTRPFDPALDDVEPYRRTSGSVQNTFRDVCQIDVSGTGMIADPVVKDCSFKYLIANLRFT
jgi:hypothetical protein